MPTYRIHTVKMASGDHELHVDGCEWAPEEHETRLLGEFDTSDKAYDHAKSVYPQANGCHHCLPEHYDLS